MYSKAISPLEAFKAIGKYPNIKYTIHDDYAIMTMVEAGLAERLTSPMVKVSTP